MTKKQRALEIIERLKKEYPDAGCTLDYDQAWKLLVSVRLAAQCTDARVNIVVEKLYEKFPDVDALADAPVEEIEAIVKPCGLGHSKARDISACMKILRDKYDGKVPENFEELLPLPGVGRKSASVVMVEAFNQSAMPVDTHVFRVARRLNLSKSNTVLGVEKDLRDVFDENMYDYKELHHLLILFGRYYCKAVNPSCKECKFRNICTEVNKCF